MSDENRHALEREVQKDLFASEALEGLSTRRIEEVREDLDKLENRMNKRVKGRQSFPWVRIAASIAVLLTIGTLYFTVLKDLINPRDRMAIEMESTDQAREKSSKESPALPVQARGEEMDKAEILKTETSKEEVTESKPEMIIVEKQDITSNAVSQDQFQEMESENIVQEDGILAEDDAGTNNMDDVLETELVAEKVDITVEAEEAMKEEQNVISERFGLESPAAESRARSSDIARPPAMAEAPHIELAGAQEPAVATKKLSGPAEKSGALSALILSDSISALPVGGMESFRKFISENMIFPAGQNQHPQAGVIMSFGVDPAGNPQDIEIIESSGDDFSREAAICLFDRLRIVASLLKSSPEDSIISIFLRIPCSINSKTHDYSGLWMLVLTCRNIMFSLINFLNDSMPPTGRAEMLSERIQAERAPDFSAAGEFFGCHGRLLRPGRFDVRSFCHCRWPGNV